MVELERFVEERELVSDEGVNSQYVKPARGNTVAVRVLSKEANVTRNGLPRSQSESEVSLCFLVIRLSSDFTFPLMVPIEVERF